MLEYYKQIVIDFLKENHPRFYKELKEANELDETATNRAKNFLEQMEHSSDPQMDEEIFYQEMLTF